MHPMYFIIIYLLATSDDVFFLFLVTCLDPTLLIARRSRPSTIGDDAWHTLAPLPRRIIIAFFVTDRFNMPL